VWDAAEVLADWLEENEDMKKKRVLELVRKKSGVFSCLFFLSFLSFY
jgi:hypothetical protein